MLWYFSKQYFQLISTESRVPYNYVEVITSKVLRSPAWPLRNISITKPRICSVCHSHNHDLFSSFKTFHLGGVGVDLKVVGTSFWRGPESGGRANIVSWLESVEGSFRRGRVASFQNWQAKKCHLASNTCFPFDLLIMFVLYVKNAAVGWGHVCPATTQTSLKLFGFPIFWLWAYLVN